MERWIGVIAWVVVSLGIVAQFVLGMFFWYNWAGLGVLMYVGWGTWLLAVVLGWLPILVFRRRGGVEKGESYVATSVLVDSGIYAVVRHPQYLAVALLSLALIFISQHWLVAGIGVAAMLSVYIIMVGEDRRLVEKFGDDYVRYMDAVPRANIIVGLVRLARRGPRQGAGKGDTSDEIEEN